MMMIISKLITHPLLSRPCVVFEARISALFADIIASPCGSRLRGVGSVWIWLWRSQGGGERNHNYVTSVQGSGGIISFCRWTRDLRGNITAPLVIINNIWWTLSDHWSEAVVDMAIWTVLFIEYKYTISLNHCRPLI